MSVRKSQPKSKTIAVLTAVMATAILAGCVSSERDASLKTESRDGQDSRNLTSQELTPMSTPMRPHAANASFSWLTVPAQTEVDTASIQAQNISADGRVVIGEAVRRTSRGQSKKGVAQTFRWDLKNNQWAWLGADSESKESNPIGMDRTGNTIFGSQWVWQQGAVEEYDLGRQFWAYAAREDGQLLGVEPGNRITLRSLDGQKKQNWLASELFSVDATGNINEQYWFSAGGTLVSSNIHQCLTTQGCKQAQLMWWTPEEGKRLVNAQLPDEKSGFIQSNSGPQLVSSNGQWLIGSIGEGIYRWDKQGQILFLGGFQDGGSAIAISDDGLVAIGTTVDKATDRVRSWIWTQTEGLGWLNEWLHNHGVEKQSLDPFMQVKLLSADRRVLVGITPQESSKDKAEATDQESPQPPQWWRVDMSEYLRVLM